MHQPHPWLCCRWVCFVEPSATAVSEGRLSDAEGERGVWQSLPQRGGDGELWDQIQAAGVNRSYQLSGVSWVSMSTLHMGHFLLVASHWSTHAWWKRCIQGNLLKTQKRAFKVKYTTDWENSLTSKVWSHHCVKVHSIVEVGCKNKYNKQRRHSVISTKNLPGQDTQRETNRFTTCNWI